MENRNSLRDYLTVLRRQAWLIVLIPVVAFLAAHQITGRQQNIYRAQMKLVVAQTGGTGQPVIGAAGLTQTMVGLLKSEIVSGSVLRGLGLPPTSSRFEKDLKVTVTPESSVLDVSYDSPDPK